ncbi:MAG: aminotransferase class I/II-fold pyridoxal phosphate-dependent enzyme [Thermomicrobiales bacterium]
MTNVVRCALIQAGHELPMTAPVDDIRDAALAKYTRLIEESVSQGARLVALPELFAAPYFCHVTDTRWHAAAEAVPDGPTMTAMRSLASRLGIVMIVPVYEADNGRRYNSAAVIDADGQYLGVYRKHHVPTSHTGNYEPFYFHQPNLGFPIFETAVARIGIYICYDRHFPEVARVYGVKGAQLVINPSATSGPESERVWELEQQAHALANGYFVGAINRVGVGAPYDSSAFFGKSYFCDPTGRILNQGGRGAEEVVLADLDLNDIQAVGERWHTTRLFQDRRPSTYREAFASPRSDAAGCSKEKSVATAMRRELRYQPIMTQEMKDAAVEALENGRLIRSVYDESESDGARFENEVAAYMGTTHAVGVSSGWAAMHVAFLAAEIGPGDEVITVPNSFISVGDVIELVGARPIFVDIDPGTFNMDPDRIEAAITPRTRAIMPVHNNGLTCEMGPIVEIARRHNLLVITDSCQTLGSEYQGSRRETLGDIAALSFVRNKSMTCGGEGGMVVTDDPDLAYRCQLYANHGRGRYWKSEQDAEVIGLNYRLSEILAAIGRVQLRHLDDWNHQRRVNAAVYEELFADRGLPVILPPEPEWGYHTRMRYPVRAENRDGLVSHLQESGIQASAEYPVPLHLNRPYVAKYGFKRGDFPLSEAAADEIMVMPIWPGLSRDDQTYVVDTIERFYRA